MQRSSTNPRVQQLQSSIDTMAGDLAALRLEFKARDATIGALDGRMDGIEKRMESYEFQAKQLNELLVANSTKLSRVDATITNFTAFGRTLLRGLIRFAKFCLAIVSGVVIIVIGYWLLVQLHIHP